MCSLQQFLEVWRGKEKLELHRQLENNVPDDDCQQSEECKLIKAMTCMEPKGRPTCDEIIEWIEKIKKMTRYREKGKS